jgi:hypothetical protein
MREGATSAWRKHLGDVLAKAPKAERAELKRRAIELAREYDKYISQAIQLKGPKEQLAALVHTGKLGRDEEVAICTRYAKLANRRFQACDFWFSEVSGKPATDLIEESGGGHFEDEYGHEIEVVDERVASRRGRLFRVAASRTLAEREWIEKQGGEIAALTPTEDMQDLKGVDVSGSQIQIYAVLLGLPKLEEKLRKDSAKVVFAWRAWARHRDPRDPFKLPDFYAGPHDERLQAAAKQLVMEALYDAKSSLIADRLEDEGHPLGTAANLDRFLLDDELQLDLIAKKWKPPCAGSRLAPTIPTGTRASHSVTPSMPRLSGGIP